MKKIWLLIAGVMVGAPTHASASPAPTEGVAKVDDTSQDADKASVSEASSAADQWAAKHKEEPAKPKDKPAAKQETAATPKAAAPANPPTPPPPAAQPATPPPAAPAPVVPTPKPVAPRPGLNEMRGKILSISYDPKTLRLLVDGGFNVEFTYDARTSVVNGGSPIKFDDLGYNDELIVRYSGKDLYA